MPKISTVGILRAGKKTPVNEFVLVEPQGEDGEILLYETESVFLNAADAAAVIEDFESQDAELTIDFEHSSENRARDGLPSVAAGWIRQLEYDPDRGLIAHVEWTERAKELLANEEYKYFSPVLWFDKESRHVTSISSVALTNQPRMQRIKALAASRSRKPKEHDMQTPPKWAELELGLDKKDVNKILAQMDGDGSEADPLMQLAALLNQAGVMNIDDANYDTVLQSAIQFIKDKLGTEETKDDTGDGGGGEDGAGDGGEGEAPASRVLKALGVKSDEEGVIALKQQYVTRKDYDTLASRVEDVEARETDEKIESKIRHYVENNVLLNDPDVIDASRTLAKKLGYDDWCEHMDKQPAIVQSGRMTPARTGPTTDRNAVIAALAVQYNGQDVQLKKINSPRIWVNGELRTRGLPTLTEDEVTKFCGNGPRN